MTASGAVLLGSNLLIYQGNRQRAQDYRPASQSTTGQIEIIEIEGAVVRRAFELYAGGISSRATAERPPQP